MPDGIAWRDTSSTGKGRDSAVTHFCYAREGVFAAPLIECDGGDLIFSSILRNRDITHLFIAGLAYFLLHPGLDSAGVLVSSFQPLAPGKPDGLLGEFMSQESWPLPVT